MYVRAAFDEQDPVRLRAFIAAHSFATLVTHGERGVEASHIPLLLVGDGFELTGHLAAGNPQCDGLDGGEALAVFTGPHAYVSPGWYATQPAVPTWDYVAVHVTGRLSLVTDAGEMGESMDAMAEGDPHGFRVGQLEERYRARMYAGVRAFRLVPSRVEAQFKLSQNRSVADRLGVVAGLRGVGEEGVARLVEGTLPGG